MANSLSDQPRCFAKLLSIIAVLGHRQRNAMGGEEQCCLFASLGRNLRERIPRPLDHRLDKTWMIEKDPQLIDLRRAFADDFLRGGDVLAILSATGIAAERRGEKRD